MTGGRYDAIPLWFSPFMAISADTISLIVTALVCALLGGMAGYGLAWHRLRRARLNLIHDRKDFKKDQLAWYREQYQDSTSRIHRPAEPEQEQPAMTNEALEQLRLEMTILLEDHRIETQLLKDENQELREAVERSRTTEAVFIDLPVSETADTIADTVVDYRDEAVVTVGTEIEAITEEPVEVAEVADDAAETVNPVEEVEVIPPANESQEEEPVRKKRSNVPADIQALFLDNPERERLFPKKRSVREKPVPDKAADAPSHNRPTVNKDAPGKPSEKDASAFHFHWEAPRTPVAAPMTRSATESTRPEVPAFRSLHDMLEASVVTLSLEPIPAPTDAPDMDPVHRIVGLDRESYTLLKELGYASMEQLAGLTETETRRLAAVFRIPADRIRNEWTPSAKAGLANGNAAAQD